MPIISSNVKTLYAELAIAKTQFNIDKQPIEKKITNLKSELKTAKNSYKTIEKNIKNEEVSCEIPTKDLKKTYKDFLKAIKSVNGNNDVQLRLKKGHIKSQEYSGLNPFKRIFGNCTGSYLRQGEALKTEYELPSVKKGEVTEYLNKELKKIALVINHSSQKKEKLENEKNQLDIEIDGLHKKIDSSKNDISKLRQPVTTKEYQIARLEKKITKEIAPPPVDMGDFAAVYSTNAGFTAVQKALRNQGDVSISASEVIREIETRHGYDTFSRGAKQRAADLKFVAREIATYKTINKIDKFIYASKLTPVENGMPGPSTTKKYRLALHTDAAITLLKNARDNRQLVKPEGLFSVSKTEKGARGYAEAVSLKANTLFIVDGKSSYGLHSDYAVKSEEESVYSSYATFTVNSVETKTGFNIVKLTEKMLSFDDLRRSEVRSLPK